MQRPKSNAVIEQYTKPLPLRPTLGCRAEVGSKRVLPRLVQAVAIR